MAKRAHKVEQEIIADLTAGEWVPETDSATGEILLTEEEQEKILVDNMAETRGEEVPEVDANGRKKKVNIAMEELEQKGLKNKSQVIRFLDSEGFSRSAIALFLNVRYQHVRNVLVTELKKG